MKKQFPLLPSTKKIEDLTTDREISYRFYCDCCHEAYDSPKFPNKVSISEKERAIVLEDIVAQSMVQFHHCVQCNLWVCRDVCWNAIKRSCERCAGNAFDESPVNSAMDPHVYSSYLGAVDEVLGIQPEKLK